MQGSTVVKLVIAAVIAFVAWKWWTGQHHETPPPAERTSPAVNCVFEARQANEYFGSRIGSFTNNTQGWDSFKSEVESRISSAESKCTCADEACTQATKAMSELRAMVSDMDSAVRSGSGVPTDLVQRQERVDQALDAAKDEAK